MKHIVTFCLLFLFSTALVAHPHSFLDIKNNVLVSQGKLEGFQMSWWLDEITSSELIYEIRRSDNKAAAIEKIRQEMDDNAVEAHYFSELYNTENTLIEFKSMPFQSSLEIHGNRVIYHFTAQLSEPQLLKGQSFRLYTFEPSYYLAMEYEKPSDLTISDASLCHVGVEQPKVNQELRLYASKLDKTELPDLPADSLSLGAQFAQKVSIVCE